MIKRCHECFHCKRYRKPNGDRYITCASGNWSEEVGLGVKYLTFGEFYNDCANGNSWFNRIAMGCDDENFIDTNGRRKIINAEGKQYVKTEEKD